MRARALVFALLSGLLAVGSAQASSVMFAGDYNGNAVSRFDGFTGAALDNQNFINNGGESIAGFANTLMVEGQDNVLRFYNATTGASLNQSINLGSFGLGIVTALDGKSIYVTHSNSVEQYSIDTGNFGTLLHSAGAINAWGVTINPTDGKVYVNNGWSNSNGGIEVYNADLSGRTTLVAGNSAHGIVAGSGIVFDQTGTYFYAVNGGNAQSGQGQSYINQYQADGTFVKSAALGVILANGQQFRNAFGAAVDSEGKIYVSSQASNSVLKIDFSQNTPVPEIFVNSNNGRTQSIKTIFFNTQIINPTPEPTTMMMIASAVPVAIVVAVRRRRSIA